MANEISFTVQLTNDNGFVKSTFYPGAVSITQSAAGVHAPTVTVQSTGTLLSKGDLTSYGMMVGRNLDATKSISIGPTTGAASVYHPMLQVRAGETFGCRIKPGITLAAISTAGDTKLMLQIYED